MEIDVDILNHMQWPGQPSQTLFARTFLYRTCENGDKKPSKSEGADPYRPDLIPISLGKKVRKMYNSIKRSKGCEFMRLDLSLVEVFCAVYEEGSFSRAALKLRLSQPTISGHIKNLEDCIGAKLFDRLPRRLIPTLAGKILYRHGRLILDEKESAIHDLDKFLNRVEGPLTICASTIPGEYLLPQIIGYFHSKYPCVSIELNISDSKDVCERVLAGKAELGFAGVQYDIIGLEFRHFASDTLALIVQNNEEWKGISSITVDQLATVPFLSREVGSGTRANIEQALGRGLDEFNLVGRFGSTTAVKEALRAGLGVSILSLLAVESEISKGEFKVIDLEGCKTLNRDFFIVLNSCLTTSPIADAFIACIKYRKAKTRRVSV